MNLIEDRLSDFLVHTLADETAAGIVPVAPAATLDEEALTRAELRVQVPIDLLVMQVLENHNNFTHSLVK